MVGAVAAPAAAFRARAAGATGALALAVVVLLSGCGAASESIPPQSPAAASPSAAASPTPSPTDGGASTAAPASDVPRVDAALGVAAGAPVVQPTRVRAPSLEIDVTVAPEATDANGALALSDDPEVASWYRFGPSPWSAAGSTVIAAHVDSFDYGVGDFARLLDAPAGTQVMVESADGRVATFSVQQVSMVDKTGVDWNAVFDRTGSPRLTLVTCGGEFNYDTGHYLSNVIVTAVPVG